jgi:Na+(H+)/acetate symporter ActP
MPQMKGAGTTLAYIFPGLPYWAGVVLVGAVITLNVALGGMKGITLVQAFQYWAKMFAISVPIFVLMAVYGHYGKQLKANDPVPGAIHLPDDVTWKETAYGTSGPVKPAWRQPLISWYDYKRKHWPNPANYSVGARPVALCSVSGLLNQCMEMTGVHYVMPLEVAAAGVEFGHSNTLNGSQWVAAFEQALQQNEVELWQAGKMRREKLILIRGDTKIRYLVPESLAPAISNASVQALSGMRHTLPEKAPRDSTWISPFGPLTTKAAKAAAAALTNRVESVGKLPLKTELSSGARMTVSVESLSVDQALANYAYLTGRSLLPQRAGWGQSLLSAARDRMSGLGLMRRRAQPSSGITVHNDGLFSAAEVKEQLENFFQTKGILVVAEDANSFRAIQMKEVNANQGNPLASLYHAWLEAHERPLALLYTYSLIIALICGTAGLPHILVRFYTNPDGVAAKRTTMWVMILIGIFYVFPPVFGVMGRNLLPDLYAGAGAKGTDKIVLELPRLLNDRYPPLGSILSGITCAGAFAAFMSTFSGLLVSMTGALAHDVYGRMLRPKSTPAERMTAFKICAVVVGVVAIILGMQVESFQINFMVGQAFAIAAASYFPLLFMSTWWPGMTTKGAAAGMLTGGLLALAGISLTSFSDLAVAGGKTATIFAAFKPLDDFWKWHPLLRIICEQPAIWAVPLAITLMIVISKLTRKDVPADIRMKMLVLHAPEALGLKQEYIQDHQHGH